MDDFDSDDFNDQYDDDYDYDSDDYIQHHGGYDDLYDDIQDDYGYDAWYLEEEEDFQLPSKFCDYHPSWKKSKKTFLDLYFVAQRTKQLLDFSRVGTQEIIVNKLPLDIADGRNKVKELESANQNVEKHLAVSKKRSIAILSKVMGLPALVIDKIFIKIVESYNWHFDKFGPEEMPWRYEEVEEGDPEGLCEDDDNYTDFYYNMISEIYDRIRKCTIPRSANMDDLAFMLDGFSLEGIDGIETSASVSGDG